MDIAVADPAALIRYLHRVLDLLHKVGKGRSCAAFSPYPAVEDCKIVCRPTSYFFRCAVASFLGARAYAATPAQ